MMLTTLFVMIALGLARPVLALRRHPVSGPAGSPRHVAPNSVRRYWTPERRRRAVPANVEIRRPDR
jgi:hypothetical protein